MPSFRIVLIGIAALALLAASAYGGVVETSPLQSASLGQNVTLNGAGATLTYPLLSNIGLSYTRIHPNVYINYQPIGSIAGINAHIAKTIDFGATYPPLNVNQSLEAPHTLHIPESISAVALGYNVNDRNGNPIPSGLRLNGTVIAEIFLGNITRWNDFHIAHLNPTINLPDEPIQTVHDILAEGGTFVFTSYLTSVSTDFAVHVGNGTTVQWPVGLSTPGNAGITALIKSTPGSMGYIELAYAILSDVPYASVLNVYSNNYIAPSLDSAKAADDNLTTALPRGDQLWSNVTLLNEKAPDAYPIVTFTYIIVYKELSVVPSMDLNKAKVLADYLWYVVHDGQSFAPPLAYVPLPANIVAIDETSIRSMTFQGTPLLS